MGVVWMGSGFFERGKVKIDFVDGEGDMKLEEVLGGD